jgi:hypothetical protein
MRTKFIRFTDCWEYNKQYSKCYYSAAQVLNKWLDENPKVQVVDWKPCSLGESNQLCIVVEYIEEAIE